MGIRKTILTRFALVYFVLLLFTLIVIGKLFSVQRIKNDRWQQIEENLSKNTVVVEPTRGNICAEDGSVLATSVPGYFVRIDLAADGVKKVFNNECDSLAWHLSRFFKDASQNEYLRKLKGAYKAGNRGFLITSRKIDYLELQQLKKFPILRRGRYGGGMIVEQENKRVNPLGSLALRTIGSLNKGEYEEINGPIGYTGLERAYESYLKGQDGVSYRQNLSGRWVIRTEIEPQDGMDVVTTLNVKLQDIVESALYNQLLQSNADWATAILMEVKTGELKAIANLGKGESGYYEKDNYALGHRGCFEPGSSFKLVSLMAALEDGVVDTSDVVDTGNGSWANNGRVIRDTHGYGKLTVKQVFEKSSNIGTAKIITDHYAKNPKKYVDRVYSFGVNKALGIEIEGEGRPYFKYPGDADWWGTTLAGMSYGYETKMTPLQILTFYNAVANGGKMVKPRMVKEIRDNGILVKRFDPEVLNPMIASRETIGKAQDMLEGVCERGTGTTIQGKYFKVAGKTGTARVATSSSGYSKGMYLASFTGYFPADNPQYSLIVTFNNPRGTYYGGSVAGPVFKEISEKVYASQILASLEDEQEEDRVRNLKIAKGNTEDILEVADELELENVKGEPESLLANVEENDNQLLVTGAEFQQGLVPDVRGMGASDAIFLLENAGLKVKINGVGKVKTQSLRAGAKCSPGQTIYIALG
ncbi:PASTA domain-containing protein [Maribellus luteus]|uniref:PASTA domain-containing protein n=1 Tax=Maribellus luteus TaxID=2305463 RepID=A0A399T1Z7_9BACT|nr:penicillin-binding protein [Maribellus luteus]RIJ49059.1 PASTA domain-containing protein [Maribellus luteus]